LGTGAGFTTGAVTGVGAGAVLMAGAGVVIGGVGVVWTCFDSSAFTGLIVGAALLEHPLMANNRARNMPVIFNFRKAFKKITPFL